MTIETRLSKEQFIRLSILRHIQRRTFYFYAAICAVLTAFAIVQGPYLLLLVAWVPFTLYLLLGIVNAFRRGSDENQPFFLPTRYEFTGQGVSVSTEQGSSQLEWEQYFCVESDGPLLRAGACGGANPGHSASSSAGGPES